MLTAWTIKVLNIVFASLLGLIALRLLFRSLIATVIKGPLPKGDEALIRKRKIRPEGRKNADDSLRLDRQGA